MPLIGRSNPGTVTAVAGDFSFRWRCLALTGKWHSTARRVDRKTHPCDLSNDHDGVSPADVL